jgi:DNA replication and repair protein RecF
MLVRLLEARGFRNLDHAEVELGDRITLIHGPNGAGKTNLLEALCFGLTGASWRTRTERRLIAFGADLARAEVTVADGPESRRFLASVSTGEGRRLRVDGNQLAPAESAAARPAVAIFSPDRLALIKGPPSGRRGHLDRFAAALWPARRELRRRFGRALAQRNALVARIRSGRASEDALAAWDSEFATEAAALVEARQGAVERLASTFGSLAAALGLPGEATIGYRPRTGSADAASISEQLRERRARDIERGHSTHGPHLDEVVLALDDRSLREFGSQGEQRAGLLALLFAEREALLDARRTPPLMLLDDVMSELDPERRELLVDKLGGGGQAVITATEPPQVPDRGGRAEVEISAGRVVAAPFPL